MKSVLIIVLGHLGWSDLEAVPTPNIDALFARGRIYERFFVQPLGSLTVHTVLFGRYPARIGMTRPYVYWNPDAPRLPEDLTALPEILVQHGYATALIGKWAQGPAQAEPWEETRTTAPLRFGFQEWHAGVPSNVTAGGGTGYRDWVRVDDGEEHVEHEWADVVIRDAWRSWWRRERESPRFALVYFPSAHSPYEVPPAELLPAEYEANERRVRGRYDAMIVALDTVVGQMLAEVDFDETLVALLTDCGTPDGPNIAAEPRRVKRTTFEGGIRVPFAVAGPGVEPGRTRALHASTDIFATVLAQAGIDAPAPVDSVPLALDRDDEGKPFVFARWNDDACVRTPRYKLRVEAGAPELYDLDSDPEEREPIVPDTAAETYADLLEVLLEIAPDAAPARDDASD